MDVILISFSPPPFIFIPIFAQQKLNDVPCDKCWLATLHRHLQPQRACVHGSMYALTLIHSGQQLVALPTVSPWLEGDTGSRCDSILPDGSGRRKQEVSSLCLGGGVWMCLCVTPALVSAFHYMETYNRFVLSSLSHSEHTEQRLITQEMFSPFPDYVLDYDWCVRPPSTQRKHTKLPHYLLCCSFAGADMELSFQEAFSLPHPAVF